MVLVDLKAKPGCCEEASVVSSDYYIPCNAPAVARIAWRGRKDPSIRVCESCENHNITNRGGYRVEVA